MSQATTIYISDKSGKKFFNTVCSEEFKAPEIRNMERHIANAQKHPEMYKFLDLETARIFDNGERVMTVDEILAELEA